MKGNLNLVLPLLSHLSHALKNIETVFKGATEELLESGNEHLMAVGEDAEIALSKLSNISKVIDLLENQAEDMKDFDISTFVGLIQNYSTDKDS